jgi:quercetin dioxygenase-like cupin family protein
VNDPPIDADDDAATPLSPQEQAGRIPTDIAPRKEFDAALRPVGPAEVQLPCSPLGPTLDFFISRLNFRIESIFPADDPRVAVVSGYGLRLRLAPGEGDPGRLRLPCQDPGPANERVLIAPNGARIELVQTDPPIEIPALRPEFLVTRASDGPAAGEGRAGMIYRDLIPGRLGGRFIASHISIPGGGPVADWVHFHRVRFQMIFCARGWVRLVYEDQGPPFILAAGDCVLQPPRIRHRVLESSPGLEVVEIGSPALHETLADHLMELPTRALAPGREFSDQVFMRHVAAQTPWSAWGDTGFERRETGMARATRGLADARVLRPAGSRGFSAPAHRGELLFGFVLEGGAILECAGAHALSACDAFVIPAGEAWGLRDCTEDFELLQAELPASQP